MIDYIEQSIRTNTLDKIGIYDRLNSDSIIDILHGSIGLAGEAGELLDAIKKHIFYGAELDITNIKEELGDVMWYIAIICNTLNVSFEEIQEKNIEKLKARYPEGFTKDNALNRNLDEERKILEK